MEAQLKETVLAYLKRYLAERRDQYDSAEEYLSDEEAGDDLREIEALSDTIRRFESEA